MKPRRFKKGEITKEVWSGDIVSECEFIDDLGQGRMLFFDLKQKVFKCAFWDVGEDGSITLNGWVCASSPSKFPRLPNC